MDKPALLLNNIVKAFPGVLALDGASLEIKSGEIHGLVGENGAGKSTIIKVLAGVYQADSGSIDVFGEPLKPITPATVHRAGIRFIHQELHLVPHFSVTESVFMGQEISSPAGLSKGQMRRRAEAVLKDKLGRSISGRKLVRDLTTAERKLIQIARALIDDEARIVVFDEPTAPLASGEVVALMSAIERLKNSGITIVYISHYLDEITDICERVTVFRQGQSVAVFDTVTKATGSDLVTAMIGREIASLYPDSDRNPHGTGLSVKSLGDGKSFQNVSFEVGRGEIFGIAGLIGSGREELVDALYGVNKIRYGTIEKDGKPIKISSPAIAVANGIVLVPRDRRQDGLVLPMNILENISLSVLKQISSYGFLNRKRERQVAEQQTAKIDIRPSNPKTVTRFLSGGNQQKVVLARWLANDANIFILDEPTVGVDVGARVEIYQLIADLAANGASIIVSSSDPAELIGLCDRVATMTRGVLSGVRTTETLTVDRLVALTTGATQESANVT